MATIEKRGKSYKIIVSSGYDINGKQLRERMTWSPSAGMTPKQIEKELTRQAMLFEEQIQSGTKQDSRIKFKDFSDKFMSDYASIYLKAKTRCTYAENLAKINTALGHIRLCDLKAPHINSFYKNLQEAGVRSGTLAVCKIDFNEWLKKHHMTAPKFAQANGILPWAVKGAQHKRRIVKASADAVAAAMGAKTADVFDIQQNMAPLAPATVLAYHRTLRAVLTRAVKWGYLSTNPADSAETPSLGAHEAAYLDEPDARRLLVLLQDEPIKWRAMIIFDLLSGLRRGELLGLRWQDVDFDSQTIRISQTSNYLPGRGVYVGVPKTATSTRPLKLSRSAFLLLLEYRTWQDARRKALGDAWQDQDGRVFTRDDGRPMFPDSLTQWFTEFVQRSGLPKVTVHSLRHTYASLMIADGTPLIVVAHQLGHAQSSTTANIYAHVIASAETKALQTFDRFNDIIAPEPPTQAPPLTGKAAGD